jgi:quercetin dioxygenase-like cupin family protein
MKTKLVVSLVALAVGCLSASMCWAQVASHVMVKPDDLKWQDVPSLPPGAKMAVIEGPPNEAVPFTFRLKFPADYKVPAHSHPAVEHVTVISGAFHMGMGDKLDPAKSMALPPGSVAIMQPKTNHFGWTKDETIVQVHGVGPWGVNYVDPADDPRKK